MSATADRTRPRGPSAETASTEKSEEDEDEELEKATAKTSTAMLKFKVKALPIFRSPHSRSFGFAPCTCFHTAAGDRVLAAGYPPRDCVFDANGECNLSPGSAGPCVGVGLSDGDGKSGVNMDVGGSVHIRKRFCMQFRISPFYVAFVISSIGGNATTIYSAVISARELGRRFF